MMSKIIVYVLCTLIFILSYKKDPQKFKTFWSRCLEWRKTSKFYRNSAIIILIFAFLSIITKQYYISISYGKTTLLNILVLITGFYFILMMPYLLIHGIYSIYKAAKQKELKPNTGKTINYRLCDFIYIFLFLVYYFI